MIDTGGHSTKIEVDGGINDETAADVIRPRRHTCLRLIFQAPAGLGAAVEFAPHRRRRVVPPGGAGIVAWPRAKSSPVSAPGSQATGIPDGVNPYLASPCGAGTMGRLHAATQPDCRCRVTNAHDELEQAARLPTTSAPGRR